MLKNKFIIFDRDGTLINHVPYLYNTNDVELIPGAKSIVSNFLKRDYFLFLHTNQSGVSRGYFSLEDVKKCNNKMIQLLGLGNNIFKDICIAHDFPPETNSYRKPSTRFAEELIKKYKIGIDQITYVGDSVSDLETAFNLKCNAYGLDVSGKNNLNQNLINKKIYNFKVFNSLAEIENDILKTNI